MINVKKHWFPSLTAYDYIVPLAACVLQIIIG